MEGEGERGREREGEGERKVRLSGYNRDIEREGETRKKHMERREWKVENL